MQDHEYRALVVDDEPLVRNLTIRALGAERFQCDAAADGAEARQMFGSSRYDAVVTDLRMPNRHGHSLAVELLASDAPPVVVVLTGIMEPRLAKDLITRGADYVEFKPVNYELFAAKIRALVDRRKLQEANATASKPPLPPRPITPVASPKRAEAKHGTAREPADVENDMGRLTKLLPVSQAALEVYNMVNADAFEAQQVAAAIKRDTSLAIDVLQLANCSLFNPSGKKIVKVEGAVVRIGQKRIGELALATSALTAFTSNTLPWLDVDLAWRHSIAAGVATELLTESGSHPIAREALFLGALTHLAGRIGLGTLYPEHYLDLTKHCRDHGRPLTEEEKVTFGMSHTQVAARLLQSWHIPREICQPLSHLADTYPSLTRLGEPLRSKTEIVKLAVLVGRIAVGQWEPWEGVELPPDSVPERLGIRSFDEIIRQTRSDLNAILSWRLTQSGSKKPDKACKEVNTPLHDVAYCSLSAERVDFLAQIMPSMGVEPRICGVDVLDSDEAVVVNCVRTPPHRLNAHINPRANSGRKLIITDAADLKPFARFGEVISVPTNHGSLRSACLRFIEESRESGCVAAS
ncbi:MAG: HDOD domain-containing protein [Planctomycetota bacterium]|jgi:HD-like signal output (HDOD) protein/CheY-like chemotaxis protein